MWEDEEIGERKRWPVGAGEVREEEQPGSTSKAGPRRRGTRRGQRKLKRGRQLAFPRFIHPTPDTVEGEEDIRKVNGIGSNQVQAPQCVRSGRDWARIPGKFSRNRPRKPVPCVILLEWAIISWQGRQNE